MGTAASKYIYPPKHIPESELFQSKDGGQPAFGGRYPVAGSPLVDRAGAAMAISVTPSLNCFWRVNAHSIQYYAGGTMNASGWGYFRSAINITPTPEDGHYSAGNFDGQTHTDQPGDPYRSVEMAGNFKLNAGVTWTATLMCIENLWPNTSAYYSGHYNYLHIQGFTFGHGSW